MDDILPELPKLLSPEKHEMLWFEAYVKSEMTGAYRIEEADEAITDFCKKFSYVLTEQKVNGTKRKDHSRALDILNELNAIWNLVEFIPKYQ